MDQKIVQWVQCDNKIKEYNDKCKSIRETKDKLSQEILSELDVQKKEKKDMPTFNIQALNTSITPQISNSYEGLTNKFLTECYREYFTSEEEAKKLLLFIKGKRSVEKKISLKRDILMNLD
jgi:hypothetical protein